MKDWFILSEKERQDIINQVARVSGLPSAAVEKDLWVMVALNAVFNTEYADKIVFKGGTSLSKGWDLIERFSEDIDLGIDRTQFTDEQVETKKHVTRLRKAACKFVSEEFPDKVKKQLELLGVETPEITVQDFRDSDTDPLAIKLNYKSIVEKNPYLKPQVLIEVSARSLRDPNEQRSLVSMIGKEYPDEKFSDKAVDIPTVLPSRTFLEKIFLLHEIFQKDGKITGERMSRHLYDISRLMDTDHAEIALNDKELYQTIVKHREKLNRISGVDYANHTPSKIKFIPPIEHHKEWEKDYQSMQESMIHGDSPSFNKLIQKLEGLQSRINKLPWQLKIE